MSTPEIRVAVRDLRPFDLVDLEADPYADPAPRTSVWSHSFQFEMVEVCEIIPETPDCTAVGFENLGVVGFPPDHMLTVTRRPLGADGCPATT